MSQKNKEKENHIEVRVSTTGGNYPDGDEFEDVPVNQPIKVFLTKAAKELEITNTSDWVAEVDSDNEDIRLDPEKKYSDYDLEEQIIITYGPDEGGGG